MIRPEAPRALESASVHLPFVAGRSALLLVVALLTLGTGTHIPLTASAQTRLAVPDAKGELSGEPDRNVIAAGETFNFVLTLSDGKSRTPPDLAPLAENFQVVDRRRTSRADMVNGRPVHLDQWVMTLLPKRTGTLTIPPLSIGQLTSAPKLVQVVPAAPVDVKADTPLFVRVTTGAGPFFAQSDIPVTIRIYDRMGMMRGAMEKPVAEGATFVPDGDQRHYLKTINNQRYRVLEQSYLMRPQRSGTIDIQPLSLEATVAGTPSVNATDRDMAALLGRGAFTGQLPPERNITVRSLPVQVQVEPRPAEATGWFLPALGVTLHESWSRSPQKVQVGEALTRTITLEARGATPNQLPPIDVQPVAGLRQYEDRAETDSTWINGEMGARLEKVISVMPTRPGTFTLPALEVNWWNLERNRQEVAHLPAVTLMVEGDAPVAALGPAGTAPPDQTSSPPPVAPPAMSDGDTPLLRAALARLVTIATDALHLARAHLPVVVVGLVILAGLIFWRRLARRSRRRHAGQPIPNATARIRATAQVPPSEHEAIAALEAACKANQAAAAHAAYLAWVRRVKMDGLEQDGRATHPALTPDGELARAIGDLQTHLYGGMSDQWRGRTLLSALRRARRPARKGALRGGGAVLAPLYPHAR